MALTLRIKNAFFDHCVTSISEIWSFEFETWKTGSFVKGR